MTLLITVCAAIVSTILWYNSGFSNDKKLGTLVYMYWGASLMWFVDAVSEYIKAGADYFTPSPMDMLNDAFLGTSVTVLGLLIWLVILLISDPKGIVKKALKK
jgi:hypothetical protein